MVIAIGHLISLMDAEYANYYTREVMLILIHSRSPEGGIGEARTPPEFKK